MFPPYRKRTFSIAGESYAGKYVPELAKLINDKKNDLSLDINLKGILLGNPDTDDAEDWTGMMDYPWSHAVILDETHMIIRKSSNFDSNDTWSNGDCTDAVDELLRQYKEIDICSLYTSVCIGDSGSSDEKFTQIMFRRSTKMVNDFSLIDFR